MICSVKTSGVWIRSAYIVTKNLIQIRLVDERSHFLRMTTKMCEQKKEMEGFV